MSVTTRSAVPSDAPAICAILNEIIAIGGTTAHETPFDVAGIESGYITHPNLIRCTVAEIEDVVVGFQGIWRADPSNSGPDAIPAGWADIGSFVKVGITGQGIGKALFAATQKAARAEGIIAIDATIRADNASGLRFYSGMGFVDYAVLKDVPLKDGSPMDRIRKRFDL